MAATRPAALGFSVHTGWAALVALSGPADAPQVVDRRRIELIDGPDADAARFLYHLASELDLPAARAGDPHHQDDRPRHARRVAQRSAS